MKIMFRTDASRDIGTGHVMRCCTLAEELHAAGSEIHFVCRHISDNLREMLLAKGFAVSLLGRIAETVSDTYTLAHSTWLGASQADDAAATLEVIKNDTFDWIIVDHYALDKSWESTMRQVAKRIMVIDDLADRHHVCDVLFDQNFYHDQLNRYYGLVPKDCQLLIGPSYALLRNEFKQYRSHTDIRTGAVNSILVFFGGVDQFDYTTKAVLALSNISKSNIRVNVVIGAQHPNHDSLISLCDSFGFNLHIQTNKMAELMSKADLAIGGGGGAVWERACLKLPTLSIPIAEHQIMQLNDLSQSGVVYRFDCKDVTSQKIQKHAEALIENSALRHLLSTNSARLVDGDGASKVSRILLTPTKLTIRLATFADVQDIYHWRNDSKVRAASFNQNCITFEHHEQWFRKTLDNPDRLILIGELNEKPVGVVRFDICDASAEVSIYLIQDINNKGLGQSLLRSAEEWLIMNRKDIFTIKANVIEENDSSQRFFIRANYKPVSRSYEKVI